jgi:hypothetical protein
MDISIFTKELTPDLIPKIKSRFADFQMDIDFHPSFKFDERVNTGFLPVKLKVHPGQSTKYDKISSEIQSGFELYFSNYNFHEELKNIQQQALQTERKSFLSKLFGGSKTPAMTPVNFVADEELDKLLKNCKKVITVNWKSWNKSELRTSLFFAAFVAELTDGVIYEPYNGRYLSATDALQTFPMEVNEYEQSFTKDEFTLNAFEGWH